MHRHTTEGGKNEVQIAFSSVSNNTFKNKIQNQKAESQHRSTRVTFIGQELMAAIRKMHNDRE